MKKINNQIIFAVVLLIIAIGALAAGGIMFAGELNDIRNINVTLIIIGAILLYIGVYGLSWGLKKFVAMSAFKHIFKCLKFEGMRSVKEIAQKGHTSVERIKKNLQKMSEKGIISYYQFDHTGLEIAEIYFPEE